MLVQEPITLAGANADEHQHGGRKFCDKSVNEELKNIKLILFLIHKLFR